MRFGILVCLCAASALNISFTNETDEILHRDRSKIQDSLVALRGFLSAHRNDSREQNTATEVNTPNLSSTSSSVASPILTSSSLSSSLSSSSSSSSPPSLPTDKSPGFTPREARNNLRAESKVHISPQFQHHSPNSEPVPLVYAKPKESWLNGHKNAPSPNEDTASVDTAFVSETPTSVLEEEWTAEEFWEPQTTVELGSVSAVNQTGSVETTSAPFQVYDSSRLQSEYARLQSTAPTTPTSRMEPIVSPAPPEDRIWGNVQLNRTRRRRGKAPRKKVNFPRLNWLKSAGTRIRIPSPIPYFFIALFTI